ncbi:MAG: Dam family site-specific DNA-(adenine-N6)-methyltransferase [Clostridia bacterium]|nr:Dam family site-specific DNA-(adenine-N6)-methyltransferase [Clostridia bacterium]
MLSFMSAKEAAEKWNISQRRVSVLCSENRIDGAMMVGNMWIIPSTAEKPLDLRTVRYEKQHTVELKPFVKWVGGKSQLIDELEKMLPAGGEKILTKYCEPMVGGGALFFNILSKYDFEELYISDINSELINAYQVIKSNVDSLIKKLHEMQMLFLPMDENGRKYYYYSIRDKFNALALREDTAIEKASYFIFLNKTCFNGLYRVNRKGQFNVPMGAYKNPTICDEDNLRNIHEALQNVTIVCGDYSLAKQFVDKDTFVYLDPPYRPISETSGFTSYNTDAFDDNEQIRLARFIDEINATGAKIVLSNSDPKNVNPEDSFFDDLYSSYQIKRVSASRMINSKAESRGKINELIICN